MPSTNASTSASCVGDSFSASSRSRSRSSMLSTRNTARCPPESTGLRTAGRPDVSSACAASSVERTRGVRRLRNARLGERAAHLELVGHAVRGVDPDSREPELVRHRGHDRHGAVGRDRQHAVDPMSPSDLGDGGDVGEVDDLGDSAPRPARAPRRCGRPRRLAGRVRAHARSLGAGGGPRRRRGRTSRPPMLTPRR